MKKGQNPAAKKTAELALLLAAALILSYIEAVFPLNTGLPFVKIGLSNIAVVTVLYRYNSKTAAVFGIFKCVLALLFTGRLASLFFSLTGMVASLTGIKPKSFLFSGSRYQEQSFISGAKWLPQRSFTRARRR